MDHSFHCRYHWHWLKHSSSSNQDHNVIFLTKYSDAHDLTILRMYSKQLFELTPHVWYALSKISEAHGSATFSFKITDEWCRGCGAASEPRDHEVWASNPDGLWAFPSSIFTSLTVHHNKSKSGLNQVTQESASLWNNEKWLPWLPSSAAWGEIGLISSD